MILFQDAYTYNQKEEVDISEILDKERKLGKFNTYKTY